MKPLNLKPLAAAAIASLLALHAGAALAWDTGWRFRQDAAPEGRGSGALGIEMRRQFDRDPLATFRGTTDGSSGYTVMRNLDGGAMRGYLNKDGASLLRDHNGNFHYVNPRWQSYP